MCMLGVVALWSFVPVLVKLLFPVLDPLTISFLRSAQGAAFVLALFVCAGIGCALSSGPVGILLAA